MVYMNLLNTNEFEWKKSFEIHQLNCLLTWSIWLAIETNRYIDGIIQIVMAFCGEPISM